MEHSVHYVVLVNATAPVSTRRDATK